MTVRFESILAKEKACVKCFDMKEEKKVESFKIFMAATEKKIDLEDNKTKLKERRVELATTWENTKMLTMRMDKLDPDAAMIVCVIHVNMLNCLAAKVEADGKEVVAE
jgi:hypothetical protein